MSDLHKHTLNLRKGDYEFLRDNFKAKNIPASNVVRMIVSNFVDKLKQQHKRLDTHLDGVELDD